MKRTSIFLLLLTAILNTTKAQVQVDKFTGDVMYGLPLITVPNFRGPSVSTSISYRSDIKVDQPASEVGLGWDINAGGSIERVVNGIPDDWKDVTAPDMQSASFQKHLGALYFHSSHSSTILDFDYTQYKLDTLSNDTFRYHYPNYDTYFVTGVGMAGKIIPENFDYASVNIDTSKLNRWFYNKRWIESLELWKTDSISIGIRDIETYELSENHSYQYKTHFNYEHNLYDSVNSKSLPWSHSPISESNMLHIPQDSIYTAYPTYTGNGYNDENYSVITNRNRVRTSNYIEYFTNEEIDAGTTIENFMEYDNTFNRGNDTLFPQEGIGAYRITDPNGYTYHYSLPVYAHYNTSGSASLDQYFNLIIAEGGIMDITDSTLGYIVENDYTHEILEIKQIKKYAVKWLLTAITGPDFEDSNSNGVVDENDEGYWVKYDYGLWTESFSQRFPYYGANYAYSSRIDESIASKFLAEVDSGQISGKMLSYSETAHQLYYLNKIQTPSHTGVFCRDLRYDEQGVADNFDYYEYTSTENLKNVSETIQHQNGEGTFSFGSNLSNPDKYFRVVIDPEDVDSIKLYFDFVLVGGHSGNITDTLRVYEGTDSTGTILYEKYEGYETFSAPGSLTSSTGAIMIEYIWTDEASDIGQYDIRWESKFNNGIAGWPSGRPKTVPQLKLSKLFLFDNDDMSSVPSISAIDTLINDKLWNYSDVNRSNCYSNDWYEDNQATIDSLALQSVDLGQDYSLAKSYHNNRFVYVDTHKKTATQLEAETNKHIATNSVDSSGKLTLNEITYYGLNRTQTQPSHQFDYNASDTTDNPQYNPLKQDYWGNYKSDAPGNLLRGYVTDSSASQIDAWSLRTVTSPLGGVTEIIYESDEYEQVLSEEMAGELRGPIRTFGLSNVKSKYDGSGYLGAEWQFELESHQSAFWNWNDSLSDSATVLTVIPAVWIQQQDTDFVYYDGLATPAPNFDDFNDFGWSAVICSGDTASFSKNSYTTGVHKISGLDSYYELNYMDATPIYSNCQICVGSDYDSLAYSGNGYIQFQYSKGEKVKGGGTRVKELIVSNQSDSYKVSYTYNQGTATIEPGDYSKYKTKDFIPSAGNSEYPWPLTSVDYNPFGLAPQVGYGEVIIENKGQSTSGKGTSVFSFHVSDEGKNNFEPYVTIQDTIWEGTVGCGLGGNWDYKSRRFGIEIIDDFTSLWGKIKEQTLKDINGNKISKKMYEYERDVKGAHSNIVNYQLDAAHSSENCIVSDKYIVGIRRKYPHYLSKVTTYSNGRSSQSEIVDRDPFTGDPIETKNTSINGTQTTEEIVLAYTQNSTPDYTTMGAKSVDPDYGNFLNATYSSKSYKASEGLSTPDFSSYGKSFWKDSVRVRQYNSTDDEYIITEDSVEWYDYTKYVWTGELGDYGLFDSTEFTDINTPPTGSSNWRFISEITLMDEEQNVLEQKGYNDRFSASKLGYDNRFTYTSASNSNYVSFTATGFETTTEVETGVYYYEGEVLAQGDSHVKIDGSVLPHTGNYMQKIPSGNISGAVYKVNFDANDSLYSLQKGRTYMASVWIHEDSPSDTRLVIEIEGDTNSVSYSASDTMSISNQDAIQVGEWIQVNVNLEVPLSFTGTTAGDGLEVYVKKGAGEAWVDDLLFHSRVSGSGMNVYDQRTGRVMATLSDNNFATKYVYNDAGQVIEVWKEVLGDGWGKWVKVESRDFNFKRDFE